VRQTGLGERTIGRHALLWHLTGYQPAPPSVLHPDWTRPRQVTIGLHHSHVIPALAFFRFGVDIREVRHTPARLSVEHELAVLDDLHLIDRSGSHHFHLQLRRLLRRERIAHHVDAIRAEIENDV